MIDSYTNEKTRLDKLTGAASVVANEFERTGDKDAAVAAQVLFGMILDQIEVVNAELDRLIDKSGI